jgi:hypothetical protein
VETDVLQALVQWSRPKASLRQRWTALFCFLQLAVDLGTIDRPVGATRWPALLHLAETPVDRADEGAGDDPRRLIVRLWRRALRTGGIVTIAHEVLATWVEIAASSPPVLGALGRFLRQVARDEYDFDRLRDNLAHLAEEKPDVAVAAQELVDQLVGEAATEAGWEKRQW